MGENDVISFIREKDYVYIKELGAGAFGKTILLKDTMLNELYACKKYSPMFAVDSRYFNKFIQEIKILNLMLHKNIVRIFNNYIYPEKHTGYILMEYIDGQSLDEYLSLNPEKVYNVFEQIIDAFKYLEENKICHRDIRNGNILVRSDGIVKIIDFGFGKEFDIGTSIGNPTVRETNWICECPNEMLGEEKTYDNRTDIYFLGNLFLDIITKNNISFKYSGILRKMCLKDPQRRYQSFNEIYKELDEKTLSELVVMNKESKEIYNLFMNKLCETIEKISYSASIETDIDTILERLIQVYNKNSLERYVLDNRDVIDCFINGKYEHYSVCESDPLEIDYYIIYNIPVEFLENFINWVKSCNKTQKEVLVKNLNNRLNAISKYVDITDDDLPF